MLPSNTSVLRSYGVVHQCTDQVTKQKVAVKILPKVRTKQTRERTLRKLEREISLLGKVSRESTGVTPLIDVYDDEKYVYIVMSLNEGGDLEAILEVTVQDPSKGLVYSKQKGANKLPQE